MKDIDLSNLLEDEDTLLKAAALTYFGVGLYLAMRKKKPSVQRTPEAPAKPVQKGPRTLGEMIRMMMEEALEESGS
jgi:hypothetical protein